ncbi:hypothetical protein FGB62_29g221 [Gracilaria domingensis]|nr:hypothetical protein FGB62_29g221 [Gracilaria domingensis]
MNGAGADHVTIVVAILHGGFLSNHLANLVKVGHVAAAADDAGVRGLIQPRNLSEAGKRSVGGQRVGGDHDAVFALDGDHRRSGDNRARGARDGRARRRGCDGLVSCARRDARCRARGAAVAMEHTAADGGGRLAGTRHALTASQVSSAPRCADHTASHSINIDINIDMRRVARVRVAHGVHACTRRARMHALV